MRVTGITSYSNFLYNLGVDQSNLQQTMEQLSSQKQVNQASDNPLAASQIMTVSSALNQAKSYTSTITDATSFTQTQDSALSDISNQMLRIRSLIQSSANGTNGPDELKANKTEIQQTITSIVNDLNTNYNGKYVFGGTADSKPPYTIQYATLGDTTSDITGINFNGNSVNQTREVSQGVSVSLVTNGSQLVNGVSVTDPADTTATTPTDNTNGAPTSFGNFVGNLVKQLNLGINNAQAGDLTAAQTKLGGSILSDFDAYSQNVTNVQTQVGALENRLTIATNQNTAQTTNLTTMKSSVQDVDMAKAYMEYQKEQTAYQSTLAMGTKIMNTTILNYL